MELVHKIKKQDIVSFETQETTGFAVGMYRNDVGNPPFIGDELFLYTYPNESWNQKATSGIAIHVDENNSAKLKTSGCILKLISEENGFVNTIVVKESGDYEYSVEESGTYYVLFLQSEEDFDSIVLETTKKNTTQDFEIIEEPIGFDNMKTTIKRHEYHGMSAEVTVGELEFFGLAATMIKEAYNTDIDTELKYIVQDGNVTIYSGVIDLTTYREYNGEYFSVSCKVGEIGVKTTFNNRSTNEINLNATKTIDGVELNGKYHEQYFKPIAIPIKHLLYTNILKQKSKTIIATMNKWDGTAGEQYFVLDDTIVNEFGNVNTDAHIFKQDEEFDEQFGSGTKMDVSASMTFEVTDLEAAITGDFIASMQIQLIIGGYSVKKVDIPIVNWQGKKITLSYTGKNLDTGSIRARFLYSSPNTGNAFLWLNLNLISANITMKMFDNIADNGTKADMLLVHDALNKAAGIISENQLTIKSDWYGYKESKINPVDTFGGGSLKAITNGYKIRGLSDSDLRSMKISFADMIKSLDAIDCIGWGYANDADGIHIRVERWNWFYQNENILTIEYPKEKTRIVNTDGVITEIIIGYKKYTTNDQYNSIDTIHTERAYSSSIKSLHNSTEKICELIADNYASEETRRAKSNVDPSEEFKYDENIFIYELVAKDYSDHIDYIIANTASDVQGIARPEEMYNAKISPRHNIARQRDYLFQANNSNDMHMSSSTGNVNASFKVAGRTDSGDGYTEYSLETMEVNRTQKESENITFARSIVKAEELSLTYPITRKEYQTIMANPYGLVVVDGEDCWIKEMTYDHSTGEAEFKLIPKAK